MKATIVFLLLTASLTFAQPWTPHVIWDRSGAEDSSRYGCNILPLGDQNDDGFNDWAVHAGNDGIGTSEDPLLEFFHGGNPPDTVPYMTIHYNVGNWNAAMVVGDVNGDGYKDWLCKFYIGSDSTQIALFWGGPAAGTIPDMRFNVHYWDNFMPIGDFNGDGFDDLYWYHFSSNYGQVYYGGNPMDTLPDWTRHSPTGTEQQALPQSFGDMNGDGYSDWVSCAFTSGTTYIFLGGANPDTVPAYTWPGMAYPQGIVKDLNGDSYDDLILHAREPIPLIWGGITLNQNNSTTLSFPCEMSSPDQAVGIGDINHDGFQDLILLSEYCEDAWWGTFSVYLGYHWINPDPVLSIEGWTTPLNLIDIWTAAGLGDVNGDGVDDFAIGAVGDLEYLAWRGRVVILAGDSTIHVPADDPVILHPSAFSLSVFPNPFNSATTISFTLPKTDKVQMAV